MINNNTYIFCIHDDYLMFWYLQDKRVNLFWRKELKRIKVIVYFCNFFWTGLSKGVGFIRFDQRVEAERAIQELNGTIPKGSTEPVTVKFANNPSNNTKALPPLAAYLAAPQAAAAARRFGGPIHHATGRLRYIPLSPLSRWATAAAHLS